MKPDSLLFKTLEFYGNRVPHRGQWWLHLKLRKLLKADCDAELEVTRSGLRWVLNPSDFSQSEFFWLGTRDRWDTYHITKLLRPGFTLFDIGANFGYYSMIACQALGKQCQIHAFEPNPPMYRRLRRNIELNGFGNVIQAHPIGLSDRPGTAYLQTRPDNSGAARIVEDQQGARVSLTTLDEFCRTPKVERLDFAKIDVEGFEERVVCGGAESLQRFRPVLFVEFNPGLLVLQGSSVGAVAELLEQYRYRLHVAHRDQMRPLRHLPGAQDLINVFCFPASR